MPSLCISILIVPRTVLIVLYCIEDHTNQDGSDTFTIAVGALNDKGDLNVSDDALLQLLITIGH